VTLPLAQSEPPRYELKFQCRESVFETVMFILMAQGAALYRPYPPRIVQSIYFDTRDGRAAQETITGQSVRNKLRFRWYGENQDEARGALELKRRDNVLIRKGREVIASPLRIRGQSRTAFMKTVRAQISPVWRTLLDEGQEPSQWIRYERHYLAARNSPVRVTVDRGLRAWELRDSYTLRALAPTPLPCCMIVECKAPPAFYEDLQLIANALPMSRTRCSKYLMACLPGHYGFI